MAVEVTLDHDRFGEVSRLFLMPDFDVTQVQTRITQGRQQGDDEEEDDEDQSGQGGGS
jgi:general secretion pathway protein J